MMLAEARDCAVRTLMSRLVCSRSRRVSEIVSRTSARFPPTRMCSRMAVTMNSRSALLMRRSSALSASSTEVPSVISVATRSNSVETGGCDFAATVSSARSIAYPVFRELERSCSMLASCSLKSFVRRRWRYAWLATGPRPVRETPRCWRMPRCCRAALRRWTTRRQPSRATRRPGSSAPRASS